MAQAKGGAEEDALLAALYEEQGESEKLALDDSIAKKYQQGIPAAAKVALVVLLALAILVSISIGTYSMNPLDVIEAVWAHFATPDDLPDANMDIIVFNIRIPRVLTVVLVGAALAAAGVAFQALFRNPLTSPDLLGASAGASLGACIAILLGFSSLAIQGSAFVGGILAVCATLWVSSLVRSEPTLSLVLGGMLVSQLFQAGVSIVKYVADSADKLPEITFWLMGSFADVSGSDLAVCCVPILVGLAILLSQSWKLNLMSFGEEEAASLGVNVKATRIIVIAAATLITSASVAVSGIVGWVGLVVPHAARALVGSNNRTLLPVSMVLGALFLLVVDDLARTIATVEVPISILTAIVGVPFFIVVFRHNMKA